MKSMLQRSERRSELQVSHADLTALLGAFCFILSAIEYMLPKPLPFMRLGIANLPILLAVDLLPFPWFLTLAVVKVIGMSVISGTLFSFVALFSLLGTFSAALVMWAARKAGGRWITQIGVSILGAITSNAIQIFVARYVVFGEVAWLIAPLFILTGLVTGTALGIFAAHFAETSQWYAYASGVHQGDTPPSVPEIGAKSLGSSMTSQKKQKKGEQRAQRRQRFESMFTAWQLALAGAAVALVFLFERRLAVKTALFIFFILATYLAGKRFSLLTTLLVSAGIILTNLLIPSGRVLARLGPLAVTEFALTEGLLKALTFEGLMFLSKASIMPGLTVPGKLGSIVSSAFLYYDRIIEYKGKVRPATLSSDIDAMMFTVWRRELGADSTQAHAAAAASPGHKSLTGTVILMLCAVLALVFSILF